MNRKQKEWERGRERERATFAFAVSDRFLLPSRTLSRRETEAENERESDSRVRAYVCIRTARERAEREERYGSNVTRATFA